MIAVLPLCYYYFGKLKNEWEDGLMKRRMNKDKNHAK